MALEEHGGRAKGQEIWRGALSTSPSTFLDNNDL